MVEKYTTVDLGSFGTSHEVVIYTSDAEIFSWLIEEIKTIRKSYSLRHKHTDARGNLTGAVVHRLGGKDAEVLGFVKQVLLDNEYEPYATTPSGEYGHFINFRKKPSAPEKIPASASIEHTDTKSGTYVMARVRTPEKMRFTLSITTTHPAILEWLSFEAKRLIPDIELDELFMDYVTDEMKEYSIAFENERGDLGFKLKQLLLDSGWEPLDWETFRISNSA